MIEDECYPSEFMEYNNHFQQRTGDFYQQEDKLDMAIEDIRRLMVKVSQKRHIARMKEDGKILLMTTQQAYINKEKGELQHKVWKPGRQEMITIKHQQHNSVHD